LSIKDLDYLSIGMVYDIITEAQNDDFDYKNLATQADMDKW